MSLQTEWLLQLLIAMLMDILNTPTGPFHQHAQPISITDLPLVLISVTDTRTVNWMILLMLDFTM